MAALRGVGQVPCMQMPFGSGHTTMQPNGDRPVRVPVDQIPIVGGPPQVGAGGFREFCDRLGTGDLSDPCKGDIVALVHLGCGEGRRGIACDCPVEPLAIPVGDGHQVACCLRTSPAATRRQLPGQARLLEPELIRSTDSAPSRNSRLTRSTASSTATADSSASTSLPTDQKLEPCTTPIPKSRAGTHIAPSVRDRHIGVPLRGSA